MTAPLIFPADSQNRARTRRRRPRGRAGSLVLLSEEDGYLAVLAKLLRDGQISEPRVHDARIAALCVLHGVKELWSADRDFGRFPDLSVRNPLVG